VIVVLAIPVAFWLIVRGKDSDPDPALESAQGMAHRLLRGQESISTEAHGDGKYVFQSTDANAGSSTFPTHIGVGVCMDGDDAADAVRFSYLHYRPVCRNGRADVRATETSPAADRAQAHGDFT
jgi:hypothetical protein